jgi:DNA-binding NarL/FixJ family response regulator
MGSQFRIPRLQQIVLNNRGSERESPLTDRKRDVLAASAGGATIREVTSKLYLSESTVRNNLPSAIQKIEGRSKRRAQLSSIQQVSGDPRISRDASHPMDQSDKHKSHFGDLRRDNFVGRRE